jgi:hypothetical protein
MPGLLSNVFGEDHGGEDQTSQTTQDYDASGDAGLELSPTVSISQDAGGSYQGLDGSTHEWSSHTDITLSVDVDAALGAAGGLSQADGSEG